MSTTQTFLLDQGVAVTFAEIDPATVSKKEQTTGGFTIHTWGADNLLPQNRELVIMDNNIIGELIATKRSLILGGGIIPFKVIYDGEVKRREPQPVPPEIQDWMDSFDFSNKYLVEACNQLLIHANVFTGIMPGKAGGLVASMMAYKCRDMRVGFYDFGKPVYHYIFGDFNKTNKQGKSQMKKILAKAQREEYIMHTKDSLFDNGIYGHPSYWGGSEWIQLSNVIPKFHKSNIRNGYTIRFHIEIPKDAFLDLRKYAKAEASGNETEIQDCRNEAETKKQAFIDSMNKFLSGEENVGRAIYTFFAHDEDGKKIEGVKINSIEADLKDEALLKLFEKSNQANISSMGIHPSIASVETQGKLSSGSEMRNAIEIFVKIKSPLPRKILLTPFLYAIKANNWDKKYPFEWGFEDIVINKLDDDPSGSSQNITPTA